MKTFGKFHKVIGEIDELLKVDFNDLIDMHALVEWPLYERRNLEGGITAEKILETPKMIRFTTVIPPGVSFEPHWHDCNEVCYVLSGQFGDKRTNKIYKVGQKVMFGKGTTHTPYNPSKKQPCYIYVDFSKE